MKNRTTTPKPIDLITGPLTRLAQRKQTAVDKAMLLAVRRLSSKEARRIAKSQPRTSWARSRAFKEGAALGLRQIKINNLRILAATEQFLHQIRIILCQK